MVTTDPAHEQPVTANVLAREFEVPDPMKSGWAMGATMGQELVLEALEMALLRRRPERGLLHHTDRGSQYVARAYQQMLQQQNIVVSMSAREQCLDNAMMEGFWATLKGECVHEAYATRAQARLSIFEYIEVWYNRGRLHSAPGYRSPATFEQLYVQALNVSTIAG